MGPLLTVISTKGKTKHTEFILRNMTMFKTNNNKSLAAFYDSLLWGKEGTKLTYGEARPGDFYRCKK